MKKVVIAALTTAALAWALTGCASLGPQPTTWLARNSSNVDYISWTNSNGRLSGTVQNATAGSTQAGATGATVTSDSEQLTGEEANGKITLHIGGEIIGTSVTGTIDNQTLTLDGSSDGQTGTVVLHPGSFTDYQVAVKALSDRVTEGRDAATISQDKSDIAGYLISIKSEQAAITADAGTVQKDYNNMAAEQKTQARYATQAIAGRCYNSAAASSEGQAGLLSVWLTSSL